MTRYTIEADGDIVREKLEIKGKTLQRVSYRSPRGILSEDDDFSELAEAAGMEDPELLDQLFYMFDSDFNEAHFMELNDIAE